MAWAFGFDHVAVIEAEPPGHPEERPLFLRRDAGNNLGSLWPTRVQLGWVCSAYVKAGWGDCIGR